MNSNTTENLKNLMSDTKKSASSTRNNTTRTIAIIAVIVTAALILVGVVMWFLFSRSEDDLDEEEEDSDESEVGFADDAEEAVSKISSKRDSELIRDSMRLSKKSYSSFKNSKRSKVTVSRATIMENLNKGPRTSTHDEHGQPFHKYDQNGNTIPAGYLKDGTPVHYDRSGKPIPMYWHEESGALLRMDGMPIEDSDRKKAEKTVEAAAAAAAAKKVDTTDVAAAMPTVPEEETDALCRPSDSGQTKTDATEPEQCVNQKGQEEEEEAPLGQEESDVQPIEQGSNPAAEGTTDAIQEVNINDAESGGGGTARKSDSAQPKSSKYKETKKPFVETASENKEPSREEEEEEESSDGEETSESGTD